MLEIESVTELKTIKIMFTNYVRNVHVFSTISEISPRIARLTIKFCFAVREKLCIFMGLALFLASFSTYFNTACKCSYIFSAIGGKAY